MLAPQSDEEVRPVVEALRRLDPLLDVRWEPQAFRRKGYFDAAGTPTAARWEGRWQVIRYDTATSLHEARGYVLICTVTALRTEGKVPVMLDEGDYAPLGEWLVDYMRLWDRAQSHFIDAMDELWKEHEQAESIQHDSAAHQEALEKVYREHGDEYWLGRGFGSGTLRTPAPMAAPASSST